MGDISANGVEVLLTASKTFPNGIKITSFADDTDPIDKASIQIADSAMGLNGDLISWTVASKLPMVLGLIPGSEDDNNMQVLAEQNRPGKGKKTAKDVVRAVITYPDGSQETMTGGHLSDSMFGKSAASAGRIKSMVYAFQFENRTASA